jgi:hypothetical protein
MIGLRVKCLFSVFYYLSPAIFGSPQDVWSIALLRIYRKRWDVWNMIIFSHNRNKMDCVHAGINRRFKSREKILDRKQYMVFLVVCKMDALNFSVISHTTIDHSPSTSVEKTTKIPAIRKEIMTRNTSSMPIAIKP